MATKKYSKPGAVPYNQIKLEDIDRNRRLAYKQREFHSVMRILKDFGYKKDELQLPPEIVTSRELQAWKNMMITKKLAS